MDRQVRKKKIYKTTLVGTVINLILPVIKGAAGILGHSGAMIADAIHSLSDVVTDVIMLFFVRLASKPSDQNHAYGHGKYEIIASAILSLILVVVGAILMVVNVKKLYAYFSLGENIAIPGTITLWVALISVVSKEVLYQYTIRVADEVNSVGLKANAWHHRSDAFSSVAVLIGIGATILIGPQASFMEPLAGAVVAIFIIKVGAEIGMKAIGDLTEKKLPDKVEEEILQEVLKVPHAEHPHNLRTRSLGQDIAIEMDVLVDPRMTVLESHHVTVDIEKRLREKYGLGTHIVVHIEPANVQLDNRFEREEELEE